ncbi:hypothetical protein Tco_1023878 [Tanacetum coccineum]
MAATMIRESGERAAVLASISGEPAPRGSVEESQYIQILRNVEDVTLVNMKDRWSWSLECCGEFSVASVRKVLADRTLLVVSSKTRWIKAIPIKINIHV